MKRIIKKTLIKIFNPVASKLGFSNTDLCYRSAGASYHKNNLLQTFFNILKSVQFNPKYIIDVGANKGTWTREALVAFPDCRFTLLEPQSDLKEFIKDLLNQNPKVSFHAVGAGKKTGSFKFTFVDRDDSCSFNYSEDEARSMGYKQIEIPVITLNEFVAGQALPIPDIIKIDAEGLDIEVLEGASNFFGKTEVFMVEAGVVNKIFSNSFLEVINYMDKKNYRLFEITDMNRPFSTEVLWLVELVFVKRNGIIDSHKWI